MEGGRSHVLTRTLGESAFMDQPCLMGEGCPALKNPATGPEQGEEQSLKNLTRLFSPPPPPLERQLLGEK